MKQNNGENKMILAMIIITLVNLFLVNYLESLSYVEIYLPCLFLYILIYIKGIYINKKDEYRKNIKEYFIIYLFTLFSTIFLIDRIPAFEIYNYLDNINIIPFHLLYETITIEYLGINQLLFNYIGNLLMLMPLIILLILYDKKNLSYKKIFIISFLTTLLIEILELIFNVGMFDIDDFIFNILGCIFIVKILKNNNIKEFINNIFYTNLNINKKISKIILCVLVIISICLNIYYIKEIYDGYKYRSMINYVRGLSAERNTNFMYENVNIYINNLLVVYTDDTGMQYELDENIKNYITYDELISKLNKANEYDDYIEYTGENVKVYECKYINKTTFTNENYDDYCGN